MKVAPDASRIRTRSEPSGQPPRCPEGISGRVGQPSCLPDHPSGAGNGGPASDVSVAEGHLGSGRRGAEGAPLRRCEDSEAEKQMAALMAREQWVEPAGTCGAVKPTARASAPSIRRPSRNLLPASPRCAR